uniref:Uncharacterized protein n=1 Tax=viral metagenome TaxID=1070528 RepID=A0A6H1ZUD1_9ZZZZ
MPLYDFECGNCGEETRREVLWPSHNVGIGETVVMKEPCAKCGCLGFKKVMNGPIARTPGAWKP